MDFPSDVRKEMGHALYIAQKGEKHRDAKPLKGFGGEAFLRLFKATVKELIAQFIPPKSKF